MRLLAKWGEGTFRLPLPFGIPLDRSLPGRGRSGESVATLACAQYIVVCVSGLYGGFAQRQSWVFTLVSMYSAFWHWWRLKRRMRRATVLAIRAGLVALLLLLVALSLLTWRDAGNEGTFFARIEKAVRLITVRVTDQLGREQRERAESPEIAGQGSLRCNIKGNINQRGERIYHVPGGEYYEQTQLNTSKGEQWFCTEGEARAAGWRRSRR